MFWQWCFWPEPRATPTVYIGQIFILFQNTWLYWDGNRVRWFNEHTIGLSWVPKFCTFGGLFRHSKGHLETTRCHDSRPTEGTWKCAKDGRVCTAITAHQGKFQRVTKLLNVLHMRELQFFPLLSSLKSRGGEETFLCLHRHHCLTINYKLFFTGGDLLRLWSSPKPTFEEAFQPIQCTYLL